MKDEWKKDKDEGWVGALGLLMEVTQKPLQPL